MPIPDDRAEWTAAALRDFDQGDRKAIVAEIDRQLAAGAFPVPWLVLLGLLRSDVVAEEFHEAALLARLEGLRGFRWGDGPWSGEAPPEPPP